MPIYSIYKWTNQTNGKVYIGLTNDPAGRKYAHTWSAANGSKLPIHQALRKYGIENFTFEVIFNVFNKDDLGDFERQFIKEYNCCRLDGDVNGYNLTRGGEGFDSEQAKALIKRRTEEGTNPWAGERGSKHSTDLAKRLKEEGRHPSQNPEWVEARAREVRERVSNGSHHWLGSDWGEAVRSRNLDLLARGEHVWQSDEHKKKIRDLIESGQHYFGKKATCIHCGKVASLHNINKWHNDKCKQNPNCDWKARSLAIEQSKQAKIDKTKDKSPKMIVKCPHCAKTGFVGGNMKRYHFDKCKLK